MTEQRNAPVFAGDTGEAYVTAIDSPYPGYVVSIPKPQGGLLRRRFFGRGVLASYFEQARRWRDRTYRALHGAPVPMRAFHSQQANNRASDTPGVRYVVRKVRSRHDRETVYEVAVYLAEVWVVPGRDGQRPQGSRSRQFSLAKYGADEAFRLACDWRARAVDALKQGDELPGR